jgi:hypothetical protein
VREKESDQHPAFTLDHRYRDAANLPTNLYPDSIPGLAFLRVLSAPRDGAEGTLH